MWRLLHSVLIPTDDPEGFLKGLEACGAAMRPTLLISERRVNNVDPKYHYKRLMN